VEGKEEERKNSVSWEGQKEKGFWGVVMQSMVLFFFRLLFGFFFF
jgi:hypothetical protein